MKWKTMWWGIALTAETPQDRHLLKQLNDALPEKPECLYEDGAKALDKDNDGRVTLEFVRYSY